MKRTIHPDQSLAGAVREHLESIERRVSNGVRLKKIHAEFIAAGHSKSFRNFESALYRARKRSRTEAGVAPSSPVPQPVQSPALDARDSALAERQSQARAPVAQAAQPVSDYFKRKPLIKKST